MSFESWSDITKLLSQTGIAESLSATTNSVTAVSPPTQAGLTQHHTHLVGSLPGTQIDGNRDEDPAPRFQPSLFWKAMAFTLSSYCSNATSLSDEQQALFLGGPNQAGVPAGRAYPNEVTNYQLFAKADAIQIRDHLMYSQTGDSYFEYLTTYLRSVVNSSDDPKLKQARELLIAAKAKKDLTWEQARAKYAKEDDTHHPSLIEAINSDAEYIQAWNDELAFEKVYTSLQGDNMIAVSSQLDQIKYADDRLTERVNNNMTCIAVSEDYIRDPLVMSGGKMQVNMKDVYYRPFYSLPDFDATCNEWQNENFDPSRAVRVGPIPISLTGAVERSWSELGHERLDASQAPKLSSDQLKMLEKLTVTLTFIGKPAVVNVDRGFWDVPSVRRKLSSVARTLPSTVRRPFCKTIKMMFAWGIEIDVKFPAEVRSSEIGNVDLSFLKLPLTPIQARPNELQCTAGCDTYPILLAVLVSMV